MCMSSPKIPPPVPPPAPPPPPGATASSLKVQDTAKRTFKGVRLRRRGASALRIPLSGVGYSV